MSSTSIKKSADYCTYCPKMCHFSCPVAETEKNEAYTPWGKQQTAKLIREKAIPLNSENALSAYKCLTCRNSQSFCDHEIVVADSLQEIREMAIETETAPPPVLQFEEKFKKHQNPYSIDLQERLLRNVDEKFCRPKKEIVFFPTCHLISTGDSVLQKTFKLFNKLKINSLRVFDQSLQCCGYSLWNLGFKKEFEELAEIQSHSLQSAKIIVVGSPECAWSLKEVYPSLGFPLKGSIVTLPEFIADRLKNFPFRAKPEAKGSYLYHDPCYLGRYLQQYDPPRKVLEMVSGFPPEEFSCNREKSLCSGAGGGYSLIAPDEAKKIYDPNFQEMEDRDLKTLVTSCPQAYSHLKKAGKKFIVKDFISFVEENILES